MRVQCNEPSLGIFCTKNVLQSICLWWTFKKKIYNKQNYANPAILLISYKIHNSKNEQR